ncbi:hypothetical protein NMG60_11002564 [Bertholletia excelsa]
MDSSRRAVESYWRSRMIDGATPDEDKVTPVYKLEEICELLRSSHASIVKEFSEFILKRLDHKSPIVKQKALRLIKYAVVKSGVEFRREMQRNSAAVRQLFNYKGHPDPLKGDALNKAVRDTAHEAMSAIFSADDGKPAPTEDCNRRIEGFGSTNFEIPSQDKKSFLNEVVGIGSATIKQGLNSFAQTQSIKESDTGRYRSPNLQRSLTKEFDYPSNYDPVEQQTGENNSSHFSKNNDSGPWGQDSRLNQAEKTNVDDSSSNLENKTREDKLLETIVTSGGVRLQPTRDALQVFLKEAAKLNALSLSHSLESKLLSPLWQVRMKAVCVLEAILRQKDVDHFAIVASYFSENKDVIIRGCEFPQASLRDKSNKVLGLLDGEQVQSGTGHKENAVKAESTTVRMPDLIDIGCHDDSNNTEDFIEMQNDEHIVDSKTSTAPTIDDLFVDSLGPSFTSTSASEHKNNDDPFADVSFHSNESKGQMGDIFSGMSLNKPGAGEVDIAVNGNGSEPFGVFGPDPKIFHEEQNCGKGIHELVAGLSINENDTVTQQKETHLGGLFETHFAESSVNPNPQESDNVLNGVLGSGMNVNSMFPLGSMAYNIPSGLMFNPAFLPQPMNYGMMGNFFTQQQLLATMSNFQQVGNLQPQTAGVSPASGTKGGAYSSPLPDIFNPYIPTQAPSSMMSSSKKEETKAFDFISDHLVAARDPKRVV